MVPPPPPPPAHNLNLDINGDATLGDAEGASDQDGSYIKRLNEKEQQENRSQMLKREDDLIYVSPMVQGFDLKNKLWRKCFHWSLLSSH